MRLQRFKKITIVALVLTLISGATALGGIKVMAWGFNSSGQTDAPEGNNYVDVSAGAYHSVALKSDGSIVCWGLDAFGQSSAPVGKYKAVTAKGHWTMALTESGSIVAWGNNSYGQCDVPLDSDFVKIAAGETHGLALKSNGTVVAWGNNLYGQCNVVEGIYSDIAASNYSSFAINSAGQVVTWGTNVYGMMNVPGSSSLKSISTGLYHCAGLTDNGSLLMWGSNIYNQFNLPSDQIYKQVSAGAFHSVGLKEDGSIVCAGMDFNGQCSTPDGDFEWMKIYSGDFHNVALVKEPIIDVDIVITPDTLSLKSSGKWVICKVLKSSEYDVKEIVQSSLAINEQFKGEVFMYDELGNLVIKFNRANFQEKLSPGVVELMLTGKFANGKALEGDETIRVIQQLQLDVQNPGNNGKGKDSKGRRKDNHN